MLLVKKNLKLLKVLLENLPKTSIPRISAGYLGGRSPNTLSISNHKHMSNKKIKNKKGGFTLIETVIVLGVITIAAGTLMFVDLTSYNASQFQSATNNLISVLQTARASSLNNVDQSAHGVAIFPIDHPTSYVIFEGSSYSARYAPKDEIIDSGYAVDLGNGSLKEIVFDQLSGDVDANGSIVLIDHVRKLSFTISVNYEGRISW